MFNLPETTPSETQTFTVESGALRITDPCFGVDVWCSGQVANVKNGNWLAQVGYFRDESEIEMSKKFIQGRFDEEKERIEKFYKNSPDFIVEDLHRINQSKYNEEMTGLEAYKGRPAYIRIAHESNVSYSDEYDLLDIDVGVDSGQAGFFDLAKYVEVLGDKGKKHSEEGPKFKAFYSSVGDLTCGDDSFGTIEFGAVASSGYGDGSYDAYAKRNKNGELIGAIIVFIGCYEE